MSENERKQNTKKRTVNSVKLQGTHAILTPSQHKMLSINFETLLEMATASGMDTSDLLIEKFILDSLHNMTGKTVYTYQTGADRTANLSDTMTVVMDKIKVIVNEHADAILADGTPLFMGLDNIPRQMSATFTLRTPKDVTREEHVKQVQKDFAKAEKLEKLAESNNKKDNK